jgi:plastocyanin
MPLFLILVLLALFPLRADVTGSVTLKGPPKSQDETFVAEASGCGEGSVRHTENWKIGPKGELADVVVWIVDPKFPPPLPIDVTEHELLYQQIVLKQIDCRYDPHVMAITAKVPFKIVNGDPTLHNVHATVYDGPGQPPGATIFNLGQSYQGQSDEKQFDQPGIYSLQCNVHSWMQCWVMVLPHGCFDVTGADGAFKLQYGGPLPLLDGDYKIDAWHPRFAQTLEQTIHVKNGTANVNFQFDGAKSF